MQRDAFSDSPTASGPRRTEDPASESPLTNKPVGAPESQGQEPLRHPHPGVVAFPRSTTSYTDCFYAQLGMAGVEVIDGHYSGLWLLSRLKQYRVVHFHWPSFHYYKPADSWGNWLRLFRFATVLTLLRLIGKKVAWTAHNLYPHDGGRSLALHRVGRAVITRLANRIYVHGNAARDTVVREFSVAPSKTVVIDHGHFIGYYANTRSRAQARAALGLPADARVFVFVGICKPYKNLETLVRTFQSLEGAPHLLIAGKFQSAEYRARIDALIASGPGRIHMHPRFVDDSELQDFVNAADCMVLPYNEILTSGAAMLALSFGVPVIAPRLGSLSDVVSAACGALYDPRDPDGLRRTMAAFDPSAFSHDAILAQARSFSWERTTAAFIRTLDL